MKPARILTLTVTTLLMTTALASGAVPAGAADAPEQIVNGTFDSGTDPWWWTANAPGTVVNGQLCATIPGGLTNPWDAIIGQNNLVLQSGASYTLSFKASASAPAAILANVQLQDPPYTQQISAVPSLTPELQTFSYTFTSDTDTSAAQVAFQVGGKAQAWTLCLDDVSVKGGAAPPVYTPDTGPRVRVNQVGYLPAGPKNATVVTEATDPLPWQLQNAAGTVVATGQSSPRGVDPTSRQNVQSIDFSRYTTPGTGYTLSADGDTSLPFDIGAADYASLSTDALSFYYPQRSGIAIDNAIAPGYGRAAGHLGVAPNQGDTDVPCQPGVCDYRLDVHGGWYDAGDHGKYVVNGGIAVYQIMSLYERSKATFADGDLRIPEHGDQVPDVLNEARWELEFLLRMQVPAGQPLAGMVHHKVHDAQWTGLPLDPAADPQPRELHPPSTAATLNLAATAAQGARLFAPYDAAFSAKLLAAARTAWAAAQAHPAIYAPASDATGGGAYDDTNVTDEFYWAAAELYITTGEKAFSDYVLASPLHTADIFRPEGFDWQYTAPIGRLELATVPNGLSDRARVRQSVLAAADKVLATVNGNAYGISYAPGDGQFVWGSNNLVLNNLQVLASAYDISGDARYRDGVLTGLDYILGRNALNHSYVTGYGEKSSQNQHTRIFAHELNPDLPHPPNGTLSGGPNSGLQDPLAAKLLPGCAPQFCYVDDIQSYSTNELAINWNSTLAWVSAFVARQGDGAAPAKPALTASYGTLLDVCGAFVAQVTVKNTGAKPVDGWTAKWSYTGAQSIVAGVGATVRQSGPNVVAQGKQRLKPGQSATFLVVGRTPFGANWTPVITVS
jgi:endoglucanase